MNPVGEPCEGKPHARFDEGGLETRPFAGNDLCVGNPQEKPRPVVRQSSTLL